MGWCTVEDRYTIQIRICAEYRDMLPKPRLNLFYSIHFPFFYSSVGLVGTFAGLPSCPVPSATVYCNQNKASHQTIKAPRMPCCGAAGPCKHSLAFMPQDWWNWQMKWMKYVSMGSSHNKNQVNGEFFKYLWVILLFPSQESRLIPAVLELGQVRLKLIRSRIW